MALTLGLLVLLEAQPGKGAELGVPRAREGDCGRRGGHGDPPECA
jgi:hypothetical protein